MLGIDHFNLILQGLLYRIENDCLPAKMTALNARKALAVSPTSKGTRIVGAEIKYLIGLTSLQPAKQVSDSGVSFSKAGIIAA